MGGGKGSEVLQKTGIEGNDRERSRRPHNVSDGHDTTNACGGLFYLLAAE